MLYQSVLYEINPNFSICARALKIRDDTVENHAAVESFNQAISRRLIAE